MKNLHLALAGVIAFVGIAVFSPASAQADTLPPASAVSSTMSTQGATCVLNVLVGLSSACLYWDILDATTNYNGQTITVDYGTAFIADAFSLGEGASGMLTTDISVGGSNDGSSFTPITTVTGYSLTGTNVVATSTFVATGVAYRYYQLTFSNNSSVSDGLRALYFRECATNCGGGGGGGSSTSTSATSTVDQSQENLFHSFIIFLVAFFGMIWMLRKR